MFRPLKIYEYLKLTSMGLNTLKKQINQQINQQFSRRIHLLSQSSHSSQCHKSNILMLQTSTNPSTTKYKYSSYFYNFNKGLNGSVWSARWLSSKRSIPHSRQFSMRKSNTWKNYNRYYGNSNWDRLKGPALFTAAFCLGTTITMPYLMDYTPLGIFKRRPQMLVYSIIAINGVGFLMWKSPQFLKFLTRYGLLVKDNVYSNWSLLGAAFSHQSFMHLLVNMFVLQSFGSSLCMMLGASNFLMMYLNSAVISSFISIVIPTITRTSLAVGSLGASGAIFSVLGTFSYLIPKAPIALFFFPIPGGAWLAFLGSVAYNVAGLFFRWGAHDYAAHLGGSIAGVAYGWYFSKKMRERRSRMSRVSYGF